MFAPCSANVREQTRAIPGVDRDLDEEAGRRSPLPLDVSEPLRVALQRAHVRTVLAVHRDAATHRDVADDRVAGHGRAALREPHEHVLDTRHVDADAVARHRLARALRLRRDDRLGGDLVGLEPLDDLVDDLGRRELAGAERDVEVLRLLEARLADDLREHAGALQLAVRELLRLQRLVEQVAALRLGLAARLALVPLADLVAGA
jgi:hypothetical protein